MKTCIVLLILGLILVPCLAQPEDGSLSDFRALVRPGDIDQHRHGLVLGKLGQGKNSLVFQLDIFFFFNNVSMICDPTLPAPPITTYLLLLIFSSLYGR